MKDLPPEFHFDPDASPAVVRARDMAERLFRRNRGSHDWEHTLRVYRLCCDLGPREGADMPVLLVAALLHDVGRSRQDSSRGAVCHAEQGAAMTAGLAAELPLTDAQKTNVEHCVRAHRFRKAPAPATIEARVLFDADKLDAIGAVGIARAYQFAGEVGARLHNPNLEVRHTQAYTREDTGYREYQVKLRHIKDRMLTASGRRMAEGRHRFMVAFFERFIEEVEGRL
jgi:uncharacterized protein